MQMITQMDHNMTYKEWLDAGYSINDVAGDALAEAIKKTFLYRRIGFKDPEEFLYYFTNGIETFKPQYEEQMRLQPGVYNPATGLTANYDWFVQSYKKAIQKSSAESGNEHTQEDDKVTRTPDLYDYDKDITEVMTTYHDVKNIHEKEGLEYEKIEGEENRDRTGKEIHTHDGVQINTKTGGHTEEFVKGKITHKDKPQVTVRTQHGGDKAAYSGDSQVASNTPMSKQYSNAEFDSDGNKVGGEIIEPDRNGSSGKQFYEKAYQHMPALKWGTLTSQGQSGHREYANDNTYVDTEYIYKDGVEGNITEEFGTADNPDKRTVTYTGDPNNNIKGEVERTQYGENGSPIKEVTQYGDDISPINEKTSYNNRQNVHQYGDGTNPIKDTGTQSGAIGVTAPHKNGKEVTDTVHGKIVDKGNNSGKVQTIEQGRNEAPSQILKEAVSFIRSSNAWIWMRGQLDPYFSASLG